MHATNVLFAILMEMGYVLSPFPFLHHYLQAIVTVYVEFSTVRNNALDFFSLAQLFMQKHIWFAFQEMEGRYSIRTNLTAPDPPPRKGTILAHEVWNSLNCRSIPLYYFRRVIAETWHKKQMLQNETSPLEYCDKKKRKRRYLMVARSKAS